MPTMNTYIVGIKDGKRLNTTYNWKVLGPALVDALRAEELVVYNCKSDESVVAIVASNCTCKYLRERLTNLLPWLKTRSRHHIRYVVLANSKSYVDVDHEYSGNPDLEEVGTLSDWSLEEGE